MPVELLHERVEPDERWVDWGKGLLFPVGYWSAGHVGKHLPASEQVGVSDGFGPHVLPCLIELRCSGRVRTQHCVEAFDGAGVCVSGEQPP